MFIILLITIFPMYFCTLWEYVWQSGMRIHGTVGMIWSFLFRNTESSLICLYNWQTNTLTQLVCSMLIQSFHCPLLQKLMMPLFTEHCKGVANCALSSFPKVDAHRMFCARDDQIFFFGQIRIRILFVNQKIFESESEYYSRF